MSAARLVRPLALLAGVAGAVCLLGVVLLAPGPVAVPETNLSPEERGAWKRSTAQWF